VRWLGIDLGRRRVGLALSDSSATLARPWKTVTAGLTTAATVDALAAIIAELAKDSLHDSAIHGIVVGLPRRLGGEDNEQTAVTREVARLLGERTGLPVQLQDERLTSREAESRLAPRERDWRKRKLLIDAVAAAIILQDYLDESAGRPERMPDTDN
jgi:putative Holliday junction resolvase